MAASWEYKVLTLKRTGMFKITETPEDHDVATVLNKEGLQGWELVNALNYGPMRAVTLYLKRPR